MLPSSDCGEDALGVGGPGEWLGVIVVFGEVAIDGGLEVDERAEDPSLEPTPGKCRKEALHGVEPRRAGGCEMEGPAEVAGKPGTDLGVLMGGVVVDDSMHHHVRRHSGLDVVAVPCPPGSRGQIDAWRKSTKPSGDRIALYWPRPRAV